MKFLAALALVTGLAISAPVDSDIVDLTAVDHDLVDFTELHHGSLEARQSTSANELEQGSSSNCPDGILIFARGSTEAGNLVRNLIDTDSGGKTFQLISYIG